MGKIHDERRDGIDEDVDEKKNDALLDEMKVQWVGFPNMQKLIEFARYGQRVLIDGSQTTRASLDVLFWWDICSDALRAPMLAGKLQIGRISAGIIVGQH